MNKVIEIGHDTCRSRSDIRAKDVYRISTLNLSKKELEDVYYSLFDTNLELKKTINSQKDQIKVLTTKVTRLTQKNIYNPQKGCIKNTLNEHKEIITDLKQANERLVERVRLLNMQLCSAKQFVKRNPLQSARCQNCANLRNSSTITLVNTKRSQLNLRTKSTASQYDLDITPIYLGETIKDSVISIKNQEECTQNKCKTVIEELQLKIQDLQKELVKVNEQYINDSKKFTDYENVQCSLKEENLRVREQARVYDEKLQSQRMEYQDILKKLRSVEAQNETISLEMFLEKQKSRELETQLKAAEISHDIVQALSQAVRDNELKRDNESFISKKVNESFMSTGVDDSFKSDRGNESLTSMRVDESLTPTRAKSLIPVRVNELLTPVRNEESSPIKLDTPSKVEQSDDSGYLEATNKFLEHGGGGDTKLDKIIEQPKEENTKTLSDDYNRKKKKGKSRRNKRDSSIESSVEGDPSMSSKDVIVSHTELVIKDDKYIGEKQSKIIDKVTRTSKDVGIQSTAKCISRAVGDVCDRADAAVQIGDSICAMPAVDSRTYSRKSNRTYSVDAPAPAPAPCVPPADNTECEISSLSDLPSERDLSPSDYISPGEAVSSERTASSWSELSEGELPVPRHKLSYGEVDDNLSLGEQKVPLSPGVRIDRAMRVAREEADRVGRLLAGRPVHLAGVTVNPLALLRRHQQITVDWSETNNNNCSD